MAEHPFKVGQKVIVTRAYAPFSAGEVLTVYEAFFWAEDPTRPAVSFEEHAAGGGSPKRRFGFSIDSYCFIRAHGISSKEDMEALYG